MDVTDPPVSRSLYLTRLALDDARQNVHRLVITRTLVLGSVAAVLWSAGNSLAFGTLRDDLADVRSLQALTRVSPPALDSAAFFGFGGAVTMASAAQQESDERSARETLSRRAGVLSAGMLDASEVAQATAVQQHLAARIDEAYRTALSLRTEAFGVPLDLDLRRWLFWILVAIPFVELRIHLLRERVRFLSALHREAWLAEAPPALTSADGRRVAWLGDTVRDRLVAVVLLGVVGYVMLGRLFIGNYDSLAQALPIGFVLWALGVWGVRATLLMEREAAAHVRDPSVLTPVRAAIRRWRRPAITVPRMGRLRRPLGAFLILVSLVTPTAVQGCQGTTALGASLVLETATLHLPRAVSSGGEWFDGAAAPVVWMGSFFPFFGSPVLSADTASRFNLAVGMVSNYVGTLTFLLNIGLASAILGAKAVPRLRLARSVLASDRVWSVTRFLTYWIAVDAIAWLTPAPLRAAWLAVTTAALLGLTMMSKRLGFQAELRHWLPWFLVPAWLAALVVSASMLLFGLVGFLIGALLISSKSPATASDS